MQHFEIPLLLSFLYLFNEHESLASPCILAKINRLKRMNLESNELTHKDKNS